MTSVTEEHLLCLTKGAERLGAPLSAAAVTQFTVYFEELLRWSSKIDLVSQTDPSEIIRKHFLDSLAIIPLLEEHSSVLDLGSGAGFPGLPIAIALPYIRVALLEARRKRVSFLKEVARKLKTPNVTVYEGRAEVLAQQPDLRNGFAVVLTRATWNLRTFLFLSHPFIQPGGIALAMKGPQLECELRALESNSHLHDFVLQHRQRYVLPGSEEQREVVTFHKTENVSRAT